MNAFRSLVAFMAEDVVDGTMSHSFLDEGYVLFQIVFDSDAAHTACRCLYAIPEYGRRRNLNNLLISESNVELRKRVRLINLRIDEETIEFS